SDRYGLPTTGSADNGAVFAVAVSNSLGGVTSSNATLTVDPGTLVTQSANLVNLSTQNWRYYTNGTDLGTAWKEVGYSDGAWPSGQALLGFETTPAEYSEPFRTTFINPPSVSPFVVTYYFRAHFNYSPPSNPAGIALTCTGYIDDGAVWYLNGTEAGRIRVAQGQNAQTLADNQAAEGTADVLNFPPNGLVPGDNVMAVEVHQSGTTSSDIVFGMALDATTTNRTADTIAPTVVNQIPAAGAVVGDLAEIEGVFR